MKHCLRPLTEEELEFMRREIEKQETGLLEIQRTYAIHGKTYPSIARRDITAQATGTAVSANRSAQFISFTLHQATATATSSSDSPYSAPQHGPGTAEFRGGPRSRQDDLPPSAIEAVERL